MKSAELKKYLREQCGEYRAITERDELLPYFRRCPDFMRWHGNHHYPGLACHHIFGRHCEEMQWFCNLVMTSNSLHEFGHQKGGLSYNVGHAFEACSLMAKLERHNSLEWRTIPSDRADRVHWSIEQLDAIRAKCVSCKTIAVRVEVLADSLAGSLFEDVALKLVEAVK